MGLICTAIEGDEIIVTAKGTSEKTSLPLDPKSPSLPPPPSFSITLCSLHFLPALHARILTNIQPRLPLHPPQNTHNKPLRYLRPAVHPSPSHLRLLPDLSRPVHLPRRLHWSCPTHTNNQPAPCTRTKWRTYSYCVCGCGALFVGFGE